MCVGHLLFLVGRGGSGSHLEDTLCYAGPTSLEQGTHLTPVVMVAEYIYQGVSHVLCGENYCNY